MTNLLKKKTQLLTELEITEISLVDKGASPSAKVTLWKRDVSKAAHAPSDILGLRLLGVLTNRVDSLKLEQNLTRMEAWLSVLQSSEGKELLGFIGKAKSEPTSFFKGVEQQDVEELADFLEGPDGGPFLKALSKQIQKGLIVQKEKAMETVEKILKKSFESQISATKSLKLELTKKATTDDKRTPEKRLMNYLDNHRDIEKAIQELPAIVVAEAVEKRDFGKAYSKISKLVDELLSKGEVSSRAKGFMKVVDNDPALLVAYYRDQL